MNILTRGLLALFAAATTLAALTASAQDEQAPAAAAATKQKDERDGDRGHHADDGGAEGPVSARPPKRPRPGIQILETPLGGVAGFAGPGDITANPAPGRPGAYTLVCTHDYDLAPDRTQWGFARIYVPIVDEEQCDGLARGEVVSLNRRFNLVLIAHADGEGSPSTAHLNYGGLAEHLATHAFIVVSINRYADQTVAGAIDLFPAVLEAHLEHLYAGSPVRLSLNDTVALIGHSAGGRSVTAHADTVEDLGLDLRAVVLLAPTVDLATELSFNGVAEAFLGLHIFRDDDDNAFGAKAENQPMQSTFVVYDRAGTDTGSIDTLSLTKSFVFADDTSGNPAFPLSVGHYFQNRPFSRAFVNAFLQEHVNGHGIFARFLKYQERPPSLPISLSLVQMHQDAERLAVAAFEGESTQVAHALAGQILYGSGIVTASVQNTAVVDAFSPHDTGALFLEMGADTDRSVRFTFPQAVDAGPFYAFGFRITRVYQSAGLTSAPPVDFEVCIDGSCAAASAQNRPLTFPVTVATPGLTLPPNPEPAFTVANAQTKDAMRSYLFRLNGFAGLDKTDIGEISLDLGELAEGEAVIIDDVAFYPW